MTEELKNILIRELKETVSTEIKATVNGKIDRLAQEATAIKAHLVEQDKVLKSLDERVKPFEETRNWFIGFKSGLQWIAGVVVPLGIVAGGLKFLWKYLAN